MAQTSIEREIHYALEDLVNDDLETFVFHLLSRRGEPRIPRSRVKGQTRRQITEVLMETYEEEGALKVTLETLRASRFNQIAKRLAEATRSLTTSTSSSNNDAVDASGPSSQDPVNFIRDHKMELISCLKADLIILQYVHQKKIVADREYDILKSTSPPEKAVTELIDVVMRKTGEICSRFLQILQQPDVVETYSMLENIMKNWS